MSILSWAAFSLRPLIVSEITEAVLVDDEETWEELYLEGMSDKIDVEYVKREILGPCESLLEIRYSLSDNARGAAMIHLSQFSGLEYMIISMPVSSSLLITNERL